MRVLYLELICCVHIYSIYTYANINVKMYTKKFHLVCSEVLVYVKKAMYVVRVP